MPNRLQNSLSPYLQQHADNPVDWHPWGPEALEAARREQKPIFLSIGYSACHWCHVMERESFRDPTIAQLLNENFIPIKVDREERPDLDQTYLEAVQALVGHAGWPLNVFLTPDLEPFFGGTYWPPRSWAGMPGFVDVLRAVVDAWNDRRQQILDVAQQVRLAIEKANCRPVPARLPDSSLVGEVARVLQENFDPQWGGFGAAPKFPRAVELRLLLRHWWVNRDPSLRSIVEKTLSSMAAGGIHDQLGGGFHRYSVDAAWLVPHFEKMLYDNALLALTYLEAYLAWQEPEFEEITRRTLDYILRDLQLPDGAFAASEDADSEEEEGKFYLWSAEEIRQTLGDRDARLFLLAFVSPRVQVEGKFVLHRARPLSEVAKAVGGLADEPAQLLRTLVDKLFAARQKRVRPFRDDKVIVSWNALAAEALATAGAALGETRYIKAAADCLTFLRNHLWHDGMLRHFWCAGQPGGPAFLEDYATLIWCNLVMFQATGDSEYLRWGELLADKMIAEFADPVDQGFFSTPKNLDVALIRRKDVLDSVTPSGNALAAVGLIYLGSLLERSEYHRWAENAVRACLAYFSVAPLACTQAALAHELLLSGTTELVLCSCPQDPATEAALKAIHRLFLPGKLAIFVPFDEHGRPTGNHLLADWLRLLAEDAHRLQAHRTPVLYFCQQRTCQQPVVGLDDIHELLDGLSPAEPS